MATTPRAYFFEGIRFCIDTTGMAKLICSVLKEKSTKGLVSLADGSVQFSFFDHVKLLLLCMPKFLLNVSFSYIQKNRTNDGLYEIYTGISDVSKLTDILKLDGRTSVNNWKKLSNKTPSVCNMINGTDGGSFAPYVKPEGFLYIFETDICRCDSNLFLLFNIIFDNGFTYILHSHVHFAYFFIEFFPVRKDVKKFV